MGANAKQQYYFTSVWVEVKATKGIVTKRDEQAILTRHFVGGSKKQSIYINFEDKEKALNFPTTFNKPLTKVYECRIFTGNNRANVRYKGLSSWETLNFIDSASKINIDIERENFSHTFIWGGYKRLFNDSAELNNYILDTLNEIKK